MVSIMPPDSDSKSTPPPERYNPTPHVCQQCDHPLFVHDENGICTDRRQVGEYVARSACEDAEIDDWGDYYTERGAFLCENPPAAPSGFVLIECDANPRHWPTYTVCDDWGYPAPCMYCSYEQLSQSHSGCEHSHHGRWRRSRVVKKLVVHAYLSGLLAGGYSLTMSGYCDMCLSTLPGWRGKRAYILWIKRETWRCIFRGRHLPGDPIAFGYCAKCLPCPSCVSTTANHFVGCEANR